MSIKNIRIGDILAMMGRKIGDKSLTKITGSQVRAARALLRWTISDLAKNANISVPTIQAIEKAVDEPTVTDGPVKTREYRQEARATSVEKIARALVKAGITFLPDDGKGVGIRGRTKTGTG